MGLFEGALLPALDKLCSLICLLALERRLQEHPSSGYQKSAQTSIKNISKNVEGCRDGSAKNHVN